MNSSCERIPFVVCHLSTLQPDDTSMNKVADITNRPLTPMLAQYLEIKRQHPDSFLFYRMGDFYELFFDDALEGAPLLEVQLTSRDKSAENPIPMCGVPHHSAMAYVQKLLAHGKKVALCEQVEDAATAKGLVRREVSRVLTPALIGDPDLVPEESSNILASLQQINQQYELSLLDLLGSRVRSGTVASETILIDTLRQSPPKEILIPAALTERALLKTLRALFPSALITVRDKYFHETEPKAPKTLTALRAYLQETQKIDPKILTGTIDPLLSGKTLSIDSVSIRSLEILEGLFEKSAPSLAGTLDRTLTPMGRRLFRDWLSHPLAKLEEIKERHEAVRTLINDVSLQESVRKELSEIRDLERLTTKTVLGLAMPRDLVAIREILKRVPVLKTSLALCNARLLKREADALDSLDALTQRLEATLEDLPPATFREGGLIRESFDPQVRELRQLSQDAKGTIASMETREKTRTGISSLKIKYSKVFGYTIEVTSSHLSKVPKDYIRKQTIANGERFITEELKAFEEKAITADQKLKTLEESLFLRLRAEVSSFSRPLIQNARVLAELDALQSFAISSREFHFVEPEMHEGWELIIEDGRHPVVESLLPPGEFVPNSIHFSESDCRTLIITGPNMSGKSTIMRQVALISLLAHAGSFVPAKKAKIPVIDSLFTRIGSSDDIAGGRSTFMVEMSEMARILDHATDRSLILVDEIGRGTSTYDGLSLAWSIVEFLHTDVRAKTLFATHFHEVTALENALPGVRNANVLVEHWNEEIVFLHRLAPGGCNRSYGIEVAQLARLPSKVLLRARDILGVLESQSQRGNKARSRALNLGEKQMAFFDPSGASETRTRTEI
jgi:DNA mismatch repair protein MutS